MSKGFLLKSRSGSQIFTKFADVKSNWKNPQTSRGIAPSACSSIPTRRRMTTMPTSTNDLRK